MNSTMRITRSVTQTVLLFREFTLFIHLSLHTLCKTGIEFKTSYALVKFLDVALTVIEVFLPN